MKLGIHVLVLEHTTIIKVNVVVSNVVLVNNNKQLQAIHSAISETRRCRAMNFGEVITTSDSDQSSLCSMCVDKTAHIIFLVTNLIVMVEKGQKSWLIIKYNMCIYTNCLNETKKEGERSK